MLGSAIAKDRNGENAAPEFAESLRLNNFGVVSNINVVSTWRWSMYLSPKRSREDSQSRRLVEVSCSSFVTCPKQAGQNSKVCRLGLATAKRSGARIRPPGLIAHVWTNQDYQKYASKT